MWVKPKSVWNKCASSIHLARLCAAVMFASFLSRKPWILAKEPLEASQGQLPVAT